MVKTFVSLCELRNGTDFETNKIEKTATGIKCRLEIVLQLKSLAFNPAKKSSHSWKNWQL